MFAYVFLEWQLLKSTLQYLDMEVAYFQEFCYALHFL